VNVSFIEPELIAQVSHDLFTHTMDMVTLAVQIKTARDASNPNIIKVALDAEGNAMYCLGL
jgi:CMP-2-keto-3-deoxyoctulosonic acid synthetase